MTDIEIKVLSWICNNIDVGNTYDHTPQILADACNTDLGTLERVLRGFQSAGFIDKLNFRLVHTYFQTRKPAYDLYNEYSGS